MNNLSWFAWDCPGFSTECPISQEAPQFWANWDGWLTWLDLEKVNGEEGRGLKQKTSRTQEREEEEACEMTPRSLAEVTG